MCCFYLVTGLKTCVIARQVHKNQKSINSDANPINNFSMSEHGFILDNVVDDGVYRIQLKYINLNILTCFSLTLMEVL